MRRLKQIVRAARKAPPGELHELYMEVYGADFSERVTPERARASIIEACKELMDLKPAGQENDNMTTEEFQAAVIEKLDRILSLPWEMHIPKSVKAAAAEVVEDAAILDYVKANPDAKAADLIRKFKISQNRAKEFLKKPEEAPKKEITIELLREVATKYSAAFGMEDLLAVNVKFGGAKKLSQVDPKDFEMLLNEMQGRLDRENGKKATEATAMTLDEVRAKAKEYLTKNTPEQLTAVLKVFGAEKLSGLDASKYAAFVEAIGNA